MTTERYKSIGILAATLIIGILLGLLVPGFFHKMNGRRGDGGSGRHGRDMTRKGGWLTDTIVRVIGPDRDQQKKIDPVTAWASARLDSIEQTANRQATSILDSVKIRLHPLITDDQWKRLEQFDQKAKARWYRHDKGH